MPRCSCGAKLIYVEKGLWACEREQPAAPALIAALDNTNQELAAVLYERNALRAELAMIKARTCGTCYWWERSAKLTGYGRCWWMYPPDVTEARFDNASFGCAEWTARDG